MKLLKSLDLNDVVFIDIETVAGTKRLEEGTPLWDSWQYKMRHGREPLGDGDAAQMFAEQAALYAEFGKIVCITIGKIKDDVLKLKSFADHNEAKLLKDFCSTLNNIIAANKKTVLCGHAIKGFDLPWIMRRCIVNQIELPSLIDTAHLKPWETSSIDTMDLWKGTGFNGGSLIAIAVALGLHNPKDDIEGFQTTDVYYNEAAGLERITTYCEKDVLTVANIVRKCRYEPIVSAEFSELKEKRVGVLERIYNTETITKADESEIVKNINSLSAEEQPIAEELMSIVKTKKSKK